VKFDNWLEGKGIKGSEPFNDVRLIE